MQSIMHMARKVLQAMEFIWLSIIQCIFQTSSTPIQYIIYKWGFLGQPSFQNVSTDNLRHIMVPVLGTPASAKDRGHIDRATCWRYLHCHILVFCSECTGFVELGFVIFQSFLHQPSIPMTDSHGTHVVYVSGSQTSGSGPISLGSNCLCPFKGQEGALAATQFSGPHSGTGSPPQKRKTHCQHCFQRVLQKPLQRPPRLRKAQNCDRKPFPVSNYKTRSGLQSQFEFNRLNWPTSYSNLCIQQTKAKIPPAIPLTRYIPQSELEVGELSWCSPSSL